MTDLLDILLRDVDRTQVLTSEEKLLLCSRICNADRNSAISIFKLIKTYKIKFDKEVKIGENPSKIPYFGEYDEDIGIVFSATSFPELLLLILKQFVLDIELSKDYDGDTETLPIILKGITTNEKEKVQQTTQKFQIKGKKRGMKVETVTDHAGYKAKIAYMGNVNFTTELDSSTGPKTVSKDTTYCFFDGQPFDGKSVCIPYKHEFKNDIHEFSGPKCFCNIFCMYRYLIDQTDKIYYLRDSRLEKAIQLTLVAFKLMFPKDAILKPADPKECIDIYGGPLTLDQYRQQNYDRTFYSSGNVFFNEVQSADYIFEN